MFSVLGLISHEPFLPFLRFSSSMPVLSCVVAEWLAGYLANVPQLPWISPVVNPMT